MIQLNEWLCIITAALTDHDIEDLAAYYSSMSGLVDLSDR